MPNETTRVERARAFESNHGCGSIGGCPTCLRDFATQECAALEKENKELSQMYADMKAIVDSQSFQIFQREIESLTAQLADAREAMEYAVKRLDCEYADADGCIEKAQVKLKAAIDAAGAKEQ